MTHNNLKVHCAYDDTVWYADDSLSVCHSGQDVMEFIGVFPIAKFKQISVLAAPQNATLVCRLFELFHDTATQIRLVFGPETVDVTAALHGLVQPQHRSAIMHKAEYFAYRLLALKADSEPEQIDKALKQHPAWSFLSFIPFIDKHSIGNILAEIGDPRRFVHPFKPNRLSRLYAYMGVNYSNGKRFFEDETPGMNFDRALSVFNAWHNEKACEYYKQHKPSRPEDFLWRIFMTNSDPAISLTKVSKRLLDYIYLLWRAKLTTHQEVKFMPSMFFKREDELKAFYKHIGLTTN